MAKTAKNAGGRGARLGTQFRGKLASAYGHRGVAQSSLWYVFSPRTQRDWVLKSDLEWDHFVLAEADPLILDPDYAPEPLTLEMDGEVYPVPVDAVIKFVDGRVEWREIRYATALPEPSTPDRKMEWRRDAAASRGIQYSLWTENEIRPNLTLIANWRRMLAWIAAARERSLAGYQDELAAMMKSKGAFTLGELELAVGEKAFPMYAAALFSELQHGKYCADVAIVPLSPKTLVRATDGSDRS